jgi:hypothetical protein
MTNDVGICSFHKTVHRTILTRQERSLSTAHLVPFIAVLHCMLLSMPTRHPKRPQLTVCVVRCKSQERIPISVDHFYIYGVTLTEAYHIALI